MSSALQPSTFLQRPKRASRRGALRLFWPSSRFEKPKQINVSINGGVFEEPEGLDEQAAIEAGFEVDAGMVWHPDLGSVALTSGGGPAGSLMFVADTPASAARYAAFPALFLGYVPGFEYWRWSGTPWPTTFQIVQDTGSGPVTGPLPTDLQLPIAAFEGPPVTMGTPPPGTWWQLRHRNTAGALVLKRAWLCRDPASGVVRWYADPALLVNDLLPYGSDLTWYFAPPGKMPGGTVKVIVQLPQ